MAEIGYCKPPIETRFPVNRQNHTQKGPHLTTILKKLLSAKWPLKDRKLKELLKSLKLRETLEVSLALRRLLNALEGDDLAIERIFDRIDGKVAQKLKAEGFADKIIIINNGSPAREDFISKIKAQS